MLENYKELSFYARIMELRELFAKRQVAGTGAGRVSRRENDSFKEEDFEFIQLSDFLPEAELRCKELGLIPIVCIEGTLAVMTVYDEASDKSLRFTAPTCSIRTNSNGQALQAIGSQISYSRRYLWYLFLDLCTHDELDEGLYDAGLPQKRPEPKTQTPAAVAPSGQQVPAQAQTPAQTQTPVQTQIPTQATVPAQTASVAKAPMTAQKDNVPVQAPVQTSVQNPVQTTQPSRQDVLQGPPKQVQTAQRAPSAPGKWPVPPINPHPNYPYLDVAFYNAVDSSPKVRLINTIKGGKIDVSRYEREKGMKIDDMPEDMLKRIILVNVNERNRLSCVSVGGVQS